MHNEASERMKPVRISERTWPADTEPVVSICCATYQHAQFISNALEGFLMQATTFPVEILVGEDESNDGTREICQRYADAHPQLIRLRLGSRKNVIRVLGKPTGRYNALGLLKAARGRYIALCEGDDHWIDPLKLQRQVDAFENDPRATGCFTNAHNEQEGVRQPFLGGRYKAPEGPVLEEAEYLRGRGIPTCTFLFRRDLIPEYFEVIKPFATGDTALFTLLLGKGHFIYQPEFTAVRVMHPGGIYSMQGALHHLQVQLQNVKEQDKLSKGRHHALIQQRRAHALKTAWQEGLRTKNWRLARFAWKHIAKERSIMKWSIRRTLLNGFKVHFPGIDTRIEQWQWRAKNFARRSLSFGRQQRKKV